ncbi:MAG: phosphomannomutase, partial [Gemmatimonadales bacterium]
MNVPSSIFRQYDIRGVVGEQLDAQVAHAIGRAVATEARKRIGKAAQLAVGRDNRPSGDLLA